MYFWVFATSTFFLLLNCKPRQELSDLDADPYQRYVLGNGAEWKGFPEGQLTEDALKRSFQERRQLGWEIVQRAFQPAVTAQQGTGDSYIPTWLTWYTAEEIEMLFGDLYLALPQEARNKKEIAVPEETLECVMKRYATKERLQNWEGHRFNMKRIQQLQKQDAASLNRMASQVTYFSPEYVRHYLRNYAHVIDCKKPADFKYNPNDPEWKKITCFDKPFPPDAVSIKAAWMHPEKDVDFFDTSAKGIKEAFTGDEWATECLQVDGKEACKLRGDDPHLDGKIWSANVPHPDGSTRRFRLVGLHIATKALPEWTWTTIWWSPTKDDDFGFDRPEYLGKYEGKTVPELAHYKMCNVVHWEEHDQQLNQLYAAGGDQMDRTIQGALLAAQTHGYGKDKDQPLTFCSNPFIEKDAGMIDSNCIGCHQTAGPGGAMEYGRAQVQEKFPADYAWSFTSAGTAFSTDDNIQRRFSLQYRDLLNEPQEPCELPAN